MERTNHFEVFWGEMSPCEHFVQMYQDDALLLDALERFVGDGLQNDECAIVIATPSHRSSLERRLAAQGIDVSTAAVDGRYIARDAEHMLTMFMRNGWPDPDMFAEAIRALLSCTHGRRVRAFGEMVALLWAQGHSGATVRLEHLWHGLTQDQSFPLFCAYPRSGFTQDPKLSIQEICAAHSKVLGAAC